MIGTHDPHWLRLNRRGAVHDLYPYRAGGAILDDPDFKSDGVADDRVFNACPQELVAANDNRAFRRGGLM